MQRFLLFFCLVCISRFLSCLLKYTIFDVKNFYLLEIFKNISDVLDSYTLLYQLLCS